MTLIALPTRMDTTISHIGELHDAMVQTSSRTDLRPVNHLDYEDIRNGSLTYAYIGYTFPMVWNIWTTDRSSNTGFRAGPFRRYVVDSCHTQKGNPLMFCGTGWLPCWQSLSGTSDAIIPPDRVHFVHVSYSIYTRPSVPRPILGIFQVISRRYLRRTHLHHSSVS